MKQLVEQLDRLDLGALRAFTISQLRGDNPGRLRERYEATHYPIAAMYRFLSPATRESLQSIVFELMQAVASGNTTRGVLPHEVLALVDPLFNSSMYESRVRTLLLLLSGRFDDRPELRHPTLLALLRSGYKGTAEFWKPHLRADDDEALVVVMQGLAEASLIDFFAVLDELKWSHYVADCVASLTPWLVEQFGAGTVLPRLMHLLIAVPDEIGRPVLAMIDPHDVPRPRTPIEWRIAIDQYVMGESDATPWDVFGSEQKQWTALARERVLFLIGMEEWLGTWRPEVSDVGRAVRVAHVLRAHPSAAGVAGLIGALDAMPMNDGRAEPFFRESLDVIGSNPASVRQLWRVDPNARAEYARWLVRALAVPHLRQVAMAETVKWLDNPDASPFLDMVSAGGLSLQEFRDAAHGAGMSGNMILGLVVELYLSAVNAGNESIIEEIKHLEPSIERKALKHQAERPGGEFVQSIVRGRKTLGADA